VPIALAIAGSDPSGGAGIQADLKAFAALGVHGLSVVTALTAQNTQGVFGVRPTEVAFVAEQIDVLLRDLRPAATKTGMLASQAILEIIVAKIREYSLRPLVVDPVLAASAGGMLLEAAALDVLRRDLLPLATVVTPNLPEAMVLSGRVVESLADMREAARAIHALGSQTVVVKGGHLSGDADAVDVLFDGGEIVELRRARFATLHTHGTGCTFASAIAAGLALGLSIPAAVDRAKELITEAVRHGLPIGYGHGPANGMAILYERAGYLPGPDTYDPFSG
jgi:hydroxymethylpyrimidine/phosphomethylpyrimidine kinase